MKTIYKADPLKDYTRMHNSIAQSTTLSLAAKGMLLYLLSLPENWQIVASQVEKACGIGKQARRSIFSELEPHGYIKIVDFPRDNGRLSGKQWVVNRALIESLGGVEQ